MSGEGGREDREGGDEDRREEVRMGGGEGGGRR